MNPNTLLKDVLPTFIPLHHMESEPASEYPYARRWYTYADIPSESHFVFDLIMNNFKAYNLLKTAVGLFERTHNCDYRSHSMRHIEQAINITLEEYHKLFPEEQPIFYNKKWYILILALISRDRFE